MSPAWRGQRFKGTLPPRCQGHLRVDMPGQKGRGKGEGWTGHTRADTRAQTPQPPKVPCGWLLHLISFSRRPEQPSRATSPYGQPVDCCLVLISERRSDGFGNVAPFLMRQNGLLMKSAGSHNLQGLLG